MIIPHDNGFLENFRGHDRFDVPVPLYRVTGGSGGEAYLVMGSVKTALYDCGMACFKDELLANIHEIIDPLGRTLDYVFLSHTHYDHIGALPYILEEWPDIRVMGAEKAVRVFSSEAAMETMKSLGNKAAAIYGLDFSVQTEGLRIDTVLRDGDTVDLGDTGVVFYETKGHTDCSASYMVLPQRILLLSESTGQLLKPGLIEPSCLKSFNDSINSLKKMKALEPLRVISAHYGILPEEYTAEYFDDALKEIEWEWCMVKRLIKKGYTDNEISDIHDKFYWDEKMSPVHPYEAHHLNTMIVIKAVRKEMEEKNGKL